MSKSEKMNFSRELTVHIWDIRLSIQTYEEHPVWLAILQLAHENSDVVNAKLVHKELLAEKTPLLQAELLLNRVYKEGLLDKNYCLTDDGVDALDKELVPTRLTGMFTVSFVDDPLIPQVILSIDGPHEARLDGRELGHKGGARYEINGTREVPNLIEQVVDYPILLKETSESVLVKDVDRYGLPQNTSRCDLTLQIGVNNEPILRIGKPVDRRLPLPESFDISYKKALDLLLSTLGEDWQRTREIILVEFESTNSTERRAFRKSFKVSKPELPNFGSFRSMKTPAVDIEPRSKTDASKWYYWLIVDELPNQYLRQSAFTKHASDTRKKFPKKFEIKIPKQEEVAKTLFERDETNKAWLLQAPLDLLPGDAR